ncbi:MAG: adenylate/guanylate cyclase domain-containing protein [Solirubrobacteraceae bacterium]
MLCQTRLVQPPATQYVERNGIAIAYQVVGDGPFDLLLAHGFITHLDLQWTEPRFASFLARLASFARLIVYDKPGTGLSDPIAHLPTIEERSADIEAVLDAAGSERAVLFGISEGGPSVLLLAATQPQRIVSLVLCGAFANLSDILAAPATYSPALAERAARHRRAIEDVIDHWGDGTRLAGMFAPSLGEVQQRFYGMFARAAASPRMARALVDTALQLDVRDILSSVRVPTLVLHVEDDRVIPVEAGELLAAAVPDARFVGLPGSDHAFYIGANREVILLDEIERFVTGVVGQTRTGRVLATVLFTDIVDSTRQAAELGDGAWRELLEHHDALVKRIVVNHGGRIVKHLGDGALSTFDGPAKAINCAETLREAVRELGIELRAGMHTGECEAIGQDLGGLAVHIGARVSALSEPGEILVSSTVKELVIGSGMQFSDRGEHQLKGVPGVWRLYALGEERAARMQLDGPAAYMRRFDRLAVSLARRMPRTMRFGARLASRNARST